MNFEKIKSLLEKKILILDGQMGTMIQKRKLMEKDFRGKKFNNFKGEWMPGNILQTLPLIKTKNKFLIPFISSTREMSMHGIKFYFNPKNSLTSNKISIGI